MINIELLVYRRTAERGGNFCIYDREALLLLEGNIFLGTYTVTDNLKHIAIIMSDISRMP